jgi:hypothetical protein
VKILTLALAGALAFGTLGASAAPAAAHGRGHHHAYGKSHAWKCKHVRGYARTHRCGVYRGWRSHNSRYYHRDDHATVRSCRTVWVAGERVRTCTRTRY